MSRVLDQTADKNRYHLHRYIQLYPMPDYVKQASIPEEYLFESPDFQPSTVFADAAYRRWPVKTKAACYFSHIDFLEKKAELPSKLANFIEDRLATMAIYHGIKADVDLLREKHAAIHADTLGQLPDSSFAIVFVTDDGRKDRQYPLRNREEVKQAAEWLVKYRDELAFQDRHMIATRIMDKAAQFNTALPEETETVLEKQAGRGVYVPSVAAEMIRNHARAAVCPEAARDIMFKLAQSVADNPNLALDPNTTIKLAATIDQFDREYHLAGKYTDLLKRPEDVLFGASLKAASEFVKNACTLVTGNVYDQNQFTSLSLNNIRDLLGTEIAESVREGISVDPVKMAEVASTLPRPDAHMLETLMQEVGQTPRLRNAEVVKMAAEDRRQLAALYQSTSILPEPRQPRTFPAHQAAWQQG